MQQPIWKRETEIAEAISTNLLVTACVGWAPFGARSLPEKERQQQQQQAHQWVKAPQQGRVLAVLILRGSPSRLWALLPTGASKILAKTQDNKAWRPGEQMICSCSGKSAEEEKDLSSSSHDHCKSRNRAQTSAKSHQAPPRWLLFHVSK